jgi:hypothetical protein
MAISSQHITGFVIGLGAAAAGFYLYKKNQKRVDEWLGRQGIHLPPAEGSDYGSMTLEELVREKENLEDLIAEREHVAKQMGETQEPRGKRKRLATKASKLGAANA